jgi:hypothetical protein
MTCIRACSAHNTFLQDFTLFLKVYLKKQIFQGFKKVKFLTLASYIVPSNEILGCEGVGNRQLFCFFKA